MHPRQSSAKADDCGDAGTFGATKNKKNNVPTFWQIDNKLKTLCYFEEWKK